MHNFAGLSRHAYTENLMSLQLLIEAKAVQVPKRLGRIEASIQNFYYG